MSDSNKVMITLSCGTNNPNRGTRAFHLATVAQKMGKNVTMFLLDEAVYLARQGAMEHMKAATGDIADDLLAHLQAHEVPILVCTPCANARFIKEEDLEESCRLAPATELFELSENATVISL